MELEDIFTKIQKLFKSAEKTVCPLSKLKSRGGNEKEILAITSQLNNLFIKNGFITKEQEILNDDIMRKISYFLILNSNLRDKEYLINEPKVGHVVSMCPDLTICLVLDCIWGISLDKYLFEIITYGPVTLTIELLQSITESLKFALPYPLLERVRDLVFAIYQKIIRLQTERVYYYKFDDALKELDTKMIELLETFIKPESSKMSEWGVNELYRYTGYAVRSILQLILKCSDLFIEKVDDTPKLVMDLYDIEYNIGAEIFVSQSSRAEKVNNALVKANFQLLTICIANLKAINVNIYCSWHEFRLHDDKKTTLQQNIANLAYLICEKITKLEVPTDIEEETKQMLEAIAIKPLNITEEIEKADIEIITKNLNIKSDNQKLWFKRFIRVDNIILSHTSTLLNHIDLADPDDFADLLQLTFNLKNDTIKHITDINEHLDMELFQAFNNQPREIQFEISLKFFMINGINNFFKGSDYQNKLIEILNKMVSTEIEIIEFVLRDPVDCLQNLVDACLKGSDVALSLLEELKVFLKLEYQGEELGVSLAKNGYDKYLCVDSELEVFENATKSLVEKNICTADLIGKDIFLVKLYQAINAKEMKTALFWLKGCNSIYLHLTKYYMPLLLFISQIMEHSRSDIHSFSTDNIAILEMCITFITNLVDKIKTENLLNEEDISYLEKWLSSEDLPNRYYFEKLYNENIDYTKMLFDGNFQDHDRTWNTGRLLEILPFATVQEWRLITSGILKQNVDVSTYFQILIDCLSLIRKLVKPGNLRGLSCLEYSVKNLSIIIKECILPIVDSYNAQLIIWETICQFVSELPKEIQESCSFQLFNILVPLLESLKKKNEKVYNQAALDLIPLKGTETCDLICKIMLESKKT